jgi:hypothetical protein
MDEHSSDDLRHTPIRLRRELIAEGWSDRMIAAEMRAGRFVRARHGAYVDSAAWSLADAARRHELVARAVVKQAMTELVLSHTSGVPLYDAPTWGLDLANVHATRVDGKTGRDEAGVVQHAGIIKPGDVVTRHGLQVMSPTRIGLEVTTVASIEAALVVMNDLLHRRETTPEALRARYDDGMDHWPSTLGTDLAIRLANPRIESVGESRFDYLCFRQGLPRPVAQYEVFDGRGSLIARLDFAWPELGAFVEFDGKVKYEKYLKPGETPGDAVFREKRREDLVREVTGMRGMRVVWVDLDHPTQTGRRVGQLLYPSTTCAG